VATHPAHAIPINNNPLTVFNVFMVLLFCLVDCGQRRKARTHAPSRSHREAAGQKHASRANGGAAGLLFVGMKNSRFFYCDFPITQNVITRKSNTALAIPSMFLWSGRRLLDYRIARQFLRRALAIAAAHCH
jgi:hypothetical protein